MCVVTTFRIMDSAKIVTAPAAEAPAAAQDKLNSPQPRTCTEDLNENHSRCTCLKQSEAAHECRSGIYNLELKMFRKVLHQGRMKEQENISRLLCQASCETCDCREASRTEQIRFISILLELTDPTCTESEGCK